MLLFDQENQPARRSALGPTDVAGGPPGRVLEDIAREIEDTQRQQTETLTHIVERLRSVSPDRRAGAESETRAPKHRYALLDEAGDEPWDNDSAEALMRSCEADAARSTRAPTPHAMSKSQQDWIGERFDDVTQTITQALADLKPTSTISLLEQRLEAFQSQISAALRDVVRREDLDGLRLIELHVNDLGDKLDELERHVSRIDGIEGDLRNVMAQVSDERIVRLLDYDTRFTADLEVVARRAAEEVQIRLRGDDEETEAVARRHEELRALIEASIADRREAEVQAVSLVTSLSGRVSAQADRYDELKGLLEQAIQEQRQNEQTAFSMLDTLQQALVTVLDRMDALEQHQRETPAPAAAALASAPVLGPPPGADAPFGREPAPAGEPLPGEEPPYTFRDTRFESFSATEPSGLPAPGEGPEAFAERGLADTPPTDALETPIDRLRRDFIADARRAKLKATANRAEERDGENETGAETSAGPFAEARAALSQTARSSLGGGSGRLFGMSTKLLAGVLALIIAINGGLLLFTRKAADPEITPPAMSETDHGAPSEGSAAQSPPADGSNPGPRSETGESGIRSQALTPYGFQDDVLDPPVLLTLDSTDASVPHGMTIAAASATLSDRAVASVYEQQVLASLSGKLGTIAAGRSPDALLPERSGRIDATYSPPDAPLDAEEPQGGSALDLPPATVGPMSLRLAAANGDASAEFEVAARLAEGNGTGQDYAEALRWYQRSAAKGFAQSQYRLGTLYERGLGTDKDLERAKVWYSRAAENGNVKAMHNLAVLIAGGEEGDRKSVV